MPDSTHTTVCLDPAVHDALRARADESQRSISDVANEAVRALLAEDAKDPAAVRDREAEPATSFDAFVAALRSDGAL